MFITTACFFSLQNTQVHKSYENKTVFIHTAHITATHLFLYDFLPSLFPIFLICFIGINLCL